MPPKFSFGHLPSGIKEDKSSKIKSRENGSEAFNETLVSEKPFASIDNNLTSPSIKHTKSSWVSTYNRLLGGVEITTPSKSKSLSLSSDDDHNDDDSFVAWETRSSSPTRVIDSPLQLNRSVSSPQFTPRRNVNSIIRRNKKNEKIESKPIIPNSTPTRNMDPARELMEKYKNNSPSPVATYPFQKEPQNSGKARRIESDVLPLGNRGLSTTDLDLNNSIRQRNPEQVKQLYSPGYLKRSLSAKSVIAVRPLKRNSSGSGSGSGSGSSSENSAPISADCNPAVVVKLELPSDDSDEIDLEELEFLEKQFMEKKSLVDYVKRPLSPELLSDSKTDTNISDLNLLSDDDIDFEELERLEAVSRKNKLVKEEKKVSKENPQLPQSKSLLKVESLVLPPEQQQTNDMISFLADLSDEDEDDLEELDRLLKLNKSKNKNDFKSKEVIRKRISETEEDPSLQISILKPSLHRYFITTVSTDGLNTAKYNDRCITLTAIDSQDKSIEIILKGSWVDTPIEPNDIIHIIGDYHQSLTKVTVDNNENLLILSPDLLVTCTNVADSLSCRRKVVLRDRIRASGDSSRYFLIGSLTHELFQSCLAASDFSDEFIKQQINRLVFDVFLEEITLVGMTTDDAVIELNNVVPNFQGWYRLYYRPSPLPDSIVEDHRGKPSDKTLLSVNKVVDIEEEIWSPMYGLKGKIDATVEATIKKGIQSGKYLVPLELKSAKSTKSTTHRAQTTLYILLLSDRYNLDISCGVLYYFSMGEMIRIPSLWDEIRNLLNARNNLVRYMGKNNELPPVVADMYQCRNCNKNDVCMVYHKSEGGDEESSGVTFFDSYTEHLSQKHLNFFNKWENLLFKEQSDCNRYLKEIWTMTSESREKAGRCYGKMIVSELEEESGGRYTYSLQRYNKDSSDLISNEISNGDPIVISDESGHICLAKGNLRYITNNQVKITVNRRLTTSLKRLPGFTENNQVFHSMLPGINEVSNEMESRIFRIDKDEFTFGMGILRNNLLQLFVKDGDERRRKLIVDLDPPKFESQSTIPIDFKSMKLNSDQRKAIDKVLKAKDYSLILGMPGTGKTTTIAAIVQILVSQNKTVLIASHTHSAVDNILLKLRNKGFDLLRLGGITKVHPDIIPYVATYSHRATNQEEIEKYYMQPPVVGTTCLGVNNWLLSKRTFDYCIVDEASQITLPSCLGPIRLAEKFVLVGDHFQLSPLVRNIDALEGGLDVSLFKYLCESHPQAMVDLQHQYRMCSDIMLLSNKLIYDGRLKCGSEEVGNQKLQIPNKQAIDSFKIGIGKSWLHDVLDEKSNVLFLNTDNIPALEVTVGDRVQNPIEAEIVRQTVEAFRHSGVPDPSMGVISVYRSQLKLLHDVIYNTGGLEILTADRAQGRDKDCIIISLVRSNDRSNVGELLKDWRRLNVTFTRAKSKLIIIGSRRTLGTATVLSEFIQMIQNNGWMYDLPKEYNEIYRVPNSTYTNIGSYRKSPKKIIPPILSPKDVNSQPPPKLNLLNRKTLVNKRPLTSDILKDIID